MFKLFWIKVLLVVLVLVFSGFTVWADPAVPTEYSIYPHLDRIDDLPGMTYSVEAYSLFGDEYFAVANEMSGLNIYKIVGDAAVHMGSGSALGSERDVAVADWYAYVATGTQGLSSMSVAVPATPIEVDSILLPGEATRLDVSATHAFVACGTGGLVVVDITNPSALSEVGGYGTDVTAVCVDGTRLGIINSGKFEILDISTPATPVLLGAYNLATEVNYIDGVMQGDLAYVVMNDQVERLDITVPSAIVATDILPLDEPYNLSESRLEIEGSDLFVAAKQYLGIFDFATGDLRRESKQVGVITDVACRAGKIMATGEDRLEIYRDGLHDSPTPAGEFNFIGLMAPRGIIFGDIVYGVSVDPAHGLAAMELGGTGELLWTLDLETSYASQAGITHLGSTVAVMTRGGELKLATVSRYGAVLRSSLALVDYTVPLADRPVAFLDSRTVIVTDRGTTMPNSSIRVIDISDLDNPTQIGQYPLPKSTNWAVVIAGTRVVATASYSVQVFDAQDRYALQPMGNTFSFEHTGIRVYARGNYIYSMHKSNSANPEEPEHLDIWDFSNPASPIIKSRMDLASASNFVFAGDWAYQERTGLILDMSDPAQPTPAGNFSLPNPSVSQMYHVVASTENIATGNFGWVASNGYYLPAHMGVGEISAVGDDIPTVGPGLTLQAVPNPFNPRVTFQFDLAVASHTSLEIYDLRGRLVADLGSGPREAGPHRVTWDGVDVQGRDLPSGVYLARVRTDQGSATRKIVLAR